MSKKKRSLRQDLHLDKHTSHGGWPGGHRGSWNDSTPVNDQIYNWIESMGLDNNPTWARLSESKKIQVLIEAEDNIIADAENAKAEVAEEITDEAQAQGVPLNIADTNALITALVGGVGGGIGMAATGTAFTGAGIPIAAALKAVALGIDGILLVKSLYDLLQAINAAGKLSDTLEPILNRRVFSGTAFDTFKKPLTRDEVALIKSLDPNTKSQLEKYAVSYFQYQRRALISFLGAVPSATGASDIGIAAGSIVLSQGPIVEVYIAMYKAISNIINIFPGLVKLAQEDTFIGVLARFLTNPVGIYNLGQIYIALDILDPGTNEKINQYVDIESGTRASVERDVYRAGSAEREKQEAFEKEMGYRDTPNIPSQNSNNINEARVRLIIRDVLRERLEQKY